MLLIIPGKFSKVRKVFNKKYPTFIFIASWIDSIYLHCKCNWQYRILVRSIGLRSDKRNIGLEWHPMIKCIVQGYLNINTSYTTTTTTTAACMTFFCAFPRAWIESLISIDHKLIVNQWATWALKDKIAKWKQYYDELISYYHLRIYCLYNT